MALEFKDRVKDQTTTQGTGTLTISGANLAGFRNVSVHTTGATVRYLVINAPQTEWEVGEGVWTAASNTLTRDTVYASSNSNALVNFGAGIKTVVTCQTARDAAEAKAKLDGILFLKQFPFLAAGDGTTDDTAAVSAAITYAKSLGYPVKIRTGAGSFKLTSALPDLTIGITIEGDNPRTSKFICSGSATIFNIRGSGTRAAHVALKNLGIDGTATTTNYVVAIDWAQQVTFDNVYMVGCYRSVSIRQAGDVLFSKCLIDGCDGDIAVYAYGDNTTRNGENDQIDILTFENTVIQGTYVAGGPANTTKLLVLDGRVHTVQFDGLRLLNSGTGITTLNSPALAANLVPRFLTGYALEIESMWLECAVFDYCREFWVDNFFAVGSDSKDGVTLSANVNNWRVNRGSVNSNWLNGLHITGAANVNADNLTVYNNSLVGAGLKCGVYLNTGSGRVSISGGLCGKDTSLPAYTENQKYGIALDATYTGLVEVNGVDLRNNNVGAFFDSGTAAAGSHAVYCPGFNPDGTALATMVIRDGTLGTPSSGALTNCTLLPISTGVSGLGTGVGTALAVNVGSAGAFVAQNGALGTPSSGTLTSCTGLPAGSGISGLGANVATALAVAVGSAGAFVTFNGALGTPSSGTLTNATGLPIGGLTGLGTGVGTALAVNVGSAGAFVTFNGALGTPSSGTLTNCTFPTLNQNTSGSAATLTTPRAIYGNNFDGSAALAQIIASTYGGTGNGFAKFSGPATAEKTFTLPNATCTILTDNALVTVAQGGTGLNTLATNRIPYGNGTGAFQSSANLTFSGSSFGITTSGSATTLALTDTGVSGVNIALTGDGGTTPNKYIRAKSGNLEYINSAYGAVISTLTDAGALSAIAGITSFSGTAPGAGGTAGMGLFLSNTANLGIMVGTGAPTVSAAKGTLYLNATATTTTTRLYINTNGSTTWTNFTSAA